MSALRRVLIVGGSHAAIAAAERRGLEAIVLGIPEVLERSTMAACVQRVETLDLRQPLPALVRKIRTLAEEHACDGIVPIMEYALVAAAFAAQQLGLPGPSVRTVQNTRDKGRMRNVLAAAGLCTVRHAACRTPLAARAFLDDVRGPIIVKPVLGTASDGVSRVDHPDEMEAAFALAEGARSFGGVLCEELVQGPEVSVEGYTVDGVFVPVAVTDKVTNEHFLETGHSQPSIHTIEAQRALCTYVGEALQALGVTQGVSHSEVKVTRAGPVMIETHTRMGGGNIHLLTERTTGVDLADLMVAFALGEKPDVRPRDMGCGAAVRFFVARPGRIAGVVVPPRTAGIENVMVYFGAGQEIGVRSSSLDRLAHVVAVGPSAHEACVAAEGFRDQIQVEYAREGEPWNAEVA